MNFRIYLSLFLICLSTVLSFAQTKEKSKTIVDDSTKVIYGSTTTLIYSSESVFKENRIFFKKDTLFAGSVKKIDPIFNFEFKRPTLYSLEELQQKKKSDSISSMIKLEEEKKSITINDTVTYFSHDTTKSLLVKIRQFAKKLNQRKVNYEDRFYKNEYLYTKSDTSIDRIQQYNMNYINDNIYQNLGVIGTPSKPVFLTQPTTIGYQSGFNVFNVYYTDPSKVKYYNSKSPFTNIYYVGNPGTTNEDRIKLDINRNITRNWNLGFSYERIYTDKLIGQTGSNSRSLALGQEFIFYTSTKSRDGRYHFMANANYFLYFANEQGGFAKENLNNTSAENQVLSDTKVPKDVAGWPTELNATNFGVNASSTANKIFSRDRRVSYFIYHQYDISKQGKLSVFHEFDKRNQRYTFGDAITNIVLDSAVTYYKGKARLTPKTYFNQEYAFTTNKIGLKSRWDEFTLAGYYKHRYVTGSKDMTVVKAGELITSPFTTIAQWFDDPRATIRIHEHYLGGFLKYKMSDRVFFEVNGEWMFNLQNRSSKDDILNSYDVSLVPVFTNTTITSFVKDTTKVNRPDPYGNYTHKWDYNLNFKANIKRFELGLNLTRNSPSLINYFSLAHNLYNWYNDFRPTFTNSVYAKYHLANKNIFLSVQPSVFQVENYVYFNEKIQPTQTAKDTSLFYGFLDLTFNLKLGILHIDTKAKYTYIPKHQDQVIRMPEFYVNPRIYVKYVPKSKKNKQDFRLGFDIYYRSSYYGDVYMPSVGQFYVQNKDNDTNGSNFVLAENVLVDMFLTAKLRNARLFLKINQLNQLAGLTTGYYISPYQPAIGGGFQFGVHWLLFD